VSQTNNLAVAHHRPATGKAYSRDVSKTIVIDKFNAQAAEKQRCSEDKNSAKR
jgi:hypothetical protein